MWRYIITGIYIYMCALRTDNSKKSFPPPSWAFTATGVFHQPFVTFWTCLTNAKPATPTRSVAYSRTWSWHSLDHCGPVKCIECLASASYLLCSKACDKAQHAHSLTAEVMTNIQREKDGRLSRGQLNQPFSHTRIRVCIHANVHRHIILYCESTICLQPPRLQSADWMWRQPRPLGNKCSMYSP